MTEHVDATIRWWLLPPKHTRHGESEVALSQPDLLLFLASAEMAERAVGNDDDADGIRKVRELIGKVGPSGNNVGPGAELGR